MQSQNPKIQSEKPKVKEPKKTNTSQMQLKDLPLLVVLNLMQENPKQNALLKKLAENLPNSQPKSPQEVKPDAKEQAVK